MPTQNSVTWPCHSRELSCKSLNHFSECPHSSGLKSSLVVLRLEPSQLSLGTAFALFVVDLESRVGTSYWTGPAIFQNKCVPKAVAKVVAIPGVIGTIQRFNSVFGIMWSAEVGNL